MARAEADGPLAEHLQAIGKDECIYDDRDVYAVLEASSLITELESEVERLREANGALHQQAHLRRRYLIERDRVDVDENGFAWSKCCECHRPIFRHWAWSHEGGTPPQDHDADPGEDL